MRPGQQNNKRMRGRNNNNNSGGNRKGPNPLSRVYESNGPDVKIRGTAAHIAEKYVTLARDAQSSGDPVAAESYLQHAEHYFRMIAAAQAQFAPQQSFHRDERDEDVDGESEDELYVNGAPVPGLGPQPIVAMPPRENGREPYGHRDTVREPYGQREQRDFREAPPPYANGGAHGLPNGAGQAPQNAPGTDGPQPMAPAVAEAAVDGGFAPEGEERVSRRRRRGRRRGAPGEAFAGEASGPESLPGEAAPEAGDVAPSESRGSAPETVD